MLEFYKLGVGNGELKERSGGGKFDIFSNK